MSLYEIDFYCFGSRMSARLARIFFVAFFTLSCAGYPILRAPALVLFNLAARLYTTTSARYGATGIALPATLFFVYQAMSSRPRRDADTNFSQLYTKF